MSIADALQAAATEPSSKKPCRVARWIGAQPADDRDSINAWIDSGRNRTQLHRVLTTNGFPYSQSALNIHARSQCPCPRTEPQ